MFGTATVSMKVILTVIGAILTMVLLFGCESKKASVQDEIGSSKAIVEDTTQNENIAPDSSGNDFDSGCVRGHAESVTKKSIYPKAIFKLNPDNHTGVEIVDLENGDRLTIKNWGCEYYVLTFRIETDRFQADTTNMIYWLDKAVTLMKEIEGGIDAPLNISRGIEAISAHITSMDSRAYELGEEIVFNDDVIRDFVSLDRVQKINERRFAVEISFATGPL